VDNRQIRRRLPAYSEKAATDRLGIMIQKLLEANGILDRDLQAWFTSLVPSIRDRLIEYSLVDGSRMMKHIDKTLEKHLQDFKDALLAKGNGGNYAKQVASKVQDTFTDCGFKMWGDIDANTLYTHLSDMRRAGIGQRTFNCYLKACKQFCKWMIKEQRATAPSPLEHLSCVKQTEKRRQRRAISVDEVRTLLEKTQTAPERYGLSGAKRALLYRLAIETGLRASEFVPSQNHPLTLKLAPLPYRRDTANANGRTF
jgi:integrase